RFFFADASVATRRLPRGTPGGRRRAVATRDHQREQHPDRQRCGRPSHSRNCSAISALARRAVAQPRFSRTLSGFRRRGGAEASKLPRAERVRPERAFGIAASLEDAGGEGTEDRALVRRLWIASAPTPRLSARRGVLGEAQASGAEPAGA